MGRVGSARLEVSKFKPIDPSTEYGIAVYYECGVTIPVIMEKFNVSRPSVYRVIKRLGIEKDRRV